MTQSDGAARRSDSMAERLFLQLAPLTAEQRERGLRDACGDDHALRREVESLLEHHDRDDCLLDRPAPYAAVDARMAHLADERSLPPRHEAAGYRLRSVLGAGGMGVVYVAEQMRTRRTVALKVIRRAIASPSVARRFELEAAMLAKLLHPGIAQIFEAGVADFGHGEQPFIAMELVDGPAIAEYADQRGLGTRERLELVARVCDAVHHAHQRGVIHRDLKPANIVIAVDGADIGQPKVLDFGVSRAVDRERALTTAETGVGQLVGTLPYMSPEQVSGDPTDIDTRSDVYALGVLMYRLLARRLPHELDRCSIAEAARIIRDDPPPRLSSVDRTLRGDVESIVAKALSKEKEQRYASAAELAADIRRHLADEPIVARPATTMYQLKKFVRRNRALSFAIAAACVTLVAGATTASLLAWSANEASRDAQAARQKADLDAASARHQAEIAQRQAYLANIAVAAGATASNDLLAARNALDSVDPDDRDRWEWRYFDAAQDDAASVLLAPGSAVNAVRFEPDGATLVSGAFDGKVRRWDLGSERVIETCAVHERPVYAIALSADGTRIASAGADRTVRVWDVPAKREIARCEGHTDSIYGVALSPDGHRAVSASSDGTVRVWNVDDGTPLVDLTKRGGRMFALAMSRDGRLVAAGGADGDVRVWDVDGTAPIATLRGHKKLVRGLAFSSDGSTLASASNDRTVRLWDCATWSQRLQIEPSFARARSVGFNFDGSLIATGSDDHTVRIWECATGHLVAALTGHVGDVACVDWHPHDGRLATASSDTTGSIRVWDPLSASAVDVLDAHAASVMSLAFSTDGSVVTSLDVRREVRQWDAASGLALDLIAIGPATSSKGWARQCGRWLAVIYEDGRIEAIDAETWRVVARIATDIADGIPQSIAIAPDAAHVVVGNPAGAVRVYAIDAGSGSASLLGSLVGAGDGPLRIEFSPDGRLIATSDAKGLIQTWRAPCGPLVASMEHDADSKRRGDALRFSADGAVLAGSNDGESVSLWDAYTGTRAASLPTHGGARSVAFAGDGRRIATGSPDGVLRIWDAASAQLVVTMQITDSPIAALEFSPDGATLAAGAEDRVIRLFRTTPKSTAIRARAEFLAAARAAPQFVIGPAESPRDALARALEAAGAESLARRLAIFAVNAAMGDGSARTPSETNQGE